MGHILHAFSRDEQGNIVSRRYDSERIPAGWFDSPDKIDGPVVLGDEVAPPSKVEPEKSLEGHIVCPRCGRRMKAGLYGHLRACKEPVEVDNV